MTRLNIYRNGLAQWRQAAIQRRGIALVAVALPAKASCGAANQRGQVAGTICPAASKPTIRIGEFVISPEGDPRILGHPQIRY